MRLVFQDGTEYVIADVKLVALQTEMAFLLGNELSAMNEKIAAAVAEQKRVDALCLENKIRFLNDNYDNPNHGTVGRDYTRVRINILEEVLAEIKEQPK